MKYRFSHICPCEDKEFTVIYYSETGKAESMYCPFCSCLIEQDESENNNEDDE